jgi:hypothetical protein
MKKIKLILASGAFLLSGAFCPSVQASLLIESGTSTLVNASATEPLTVTWSVTETGSTYTYSYIVNNPVGDVQLNSNTGKKTTNPETVDYFSVGFDTTVPGAYILSTQAGGNSMLNNGVNGLSWNFAAVNPGSSSPTLSFESSLYPGSASANASDHNPPSPWYSSPGGQLVPAPVAAVPEPTTLISGALLLLPFGASTLRIMRRNRVA